MTDNESYLHLLAEHGVCGCVEVCGGCALCAALDPEWPCPGTDEDADYPPVDADVARRLIRFDPRSTRVGGR